MPSALHQLVGSVTDTYTVVAEHPRPCNIRPSVWEVNGPGGERWVAKQHAGPKLHRREVDAYQKWTISLGADRAPELVASDTETRAVLVTGVPGRSLDTLRVPAEQERKAYEQAGELLARHHAAAADEPMTADVTDEVWGATVAKLLDGAAQHVPDHEITLVRALLQEAPPRLPQVAAHGDYMPKNWMWEEAEQRLRIIDFEWAELQPAAHRDFSRLRYRILAQRPDLLAAFHHGYGRQLTEEELAACRAYAALDSLDSLSWGITHRDIGLVDEAHTMLENLRQESGARMWGGWGS
ncbi:aminoglycoside phosphotransferase family protein [Streptomyces gibsoniae]|uniref:Aminoglycoside phosphotransferase family protein n=1 Tax=Streptomyces gibsoniae TaxID=3075529 RepID=A0ABU2U3F5_9ACTN|nr:aminoglycoside phosphotransferase family protein [Streptomyces sp. DSM 41699]MDT0467611.1 aminoglycoside phosphotransferase family protein [Streptomyces sp. DSM 41699]